MKPPRQHENELILGLVSVSDRASQGVYRDEGIPSLEAWCGKVIKNPVRIHKRLIPDERFDIERTLRELVDIIGCDLIFTTGGTGPSRRDVTPEATLAVGTREMPGFGEQMRAISGHFVPTAILSRQVAVLRETPDHAALIVNLPGRPKAIAETLEGLKDKDGTTIVNGLFAAIPYCIDLIGGPYIETNEEFVKAFRPKSAKRPANTEQTKSSNDSPEQSAPRITCPFDKKNLDVVIPSDLEGEPDLTVVWMHGMGSDKEDFKHFAETIRRCGGPACRFILPNAPVRSITGYQGMPLRAWFDMRSADLENNEDELGMLDTAKTIDRLVDFIVQEGTPRNRIILGGFSQGAVMSLLCGLRAKEPLAGIVALSGYVPLAHRLFKEITPAGAATPVFMGHGTLDSMISPVLAHSGARALGKFTSNLHFLTYDMEHEVVPEEVADLVAFLNEVAHK